MQTATALAGGELVSRLLAFVATAYLAVVIGPEGFGVLGLAFAVFTYLDVVVTAGFTDVGAREVAVNPRRSQTLASSVAIVRLGLATAIFSGVVAWGIWLGPDPEVRSVVVLTCLLLFTASIDPAWVFKGLEQGIPVAASLIVRRLIYALLVFLLVAGPEDILTVPVVQFLAELLGVVWLTRRLFSAGFGRIDLDLGWRTFRASAALMATKLFRTSIITLDVVLLGLMATVREVGLYSAPYRFCFFLMAAAGAIQVAYLPNITQAPPGRDRREAARRHMQVSAALGIPVTGGGVVLASPLISAFFGPEYIEGVVAFQLLLGSVGILFLFAPLHNVLLAEDRLRVESWAIGLAAALNFILNILWIPSYGIVGAAWATFLAEAFILAFSILALRSTVRFALVQSLLAPLVATGVMMALLIIAPAPTSSLVVGIPVGAAIYCVALAVLGGIPEDVRETAKRLFREPST